MAEIINFAAVREARKAQAVHQAEVEASYRPGGRPIPAKSAAVPAKATVSPVASARQQIVWSKSKKGNWWMKDKTGHLVLFSNQRGWSARITPPEGEGWFYNLPPDVTNAMEARVWVENYLAGDEGAAAPSHAS